MPTLTREELYNLLWTEPTSKVAARYGLSDRGLGKLCARACIPVPPRGWWAKKAAGKRLPKQPPLPRIERGQHAHFTFSGPRPEPQRVEPNPDPPEILSERDPVNEIAVDPEGRVTHPLVRDAGIGLRKATSDYDGIRRSPRGCLDVRVSRESIQRALLMMQALVRSLEQRGYGVAIKEGKTFIVVLDEPCRIYLREGMKKQIRDLTPEEHERRRQGLDVNPYKTVPNGSLAFYEGDSYARKSTSDTKKRRLEDSLNLFIESLIRRAYEEKAGRARRQREEEESRLVEEKRKEAELRNRRELAQMERFDALVNQWHANERRRRFLVALRQSIGDVEPSSPLGEWLVWTEDYVEGSALLDRSNPAIDRQVKTGHFQPGDRDQWSFTSTHPLYASRSGPSCASSEART